MFRFVEIRDGQAIFTGGVFSEGWAAGLRLRFSHGKAIFTGGVFSEGAPFSRDEIEAEILDMADRLAQLNPNTPYLLDLRAAFEEYEKAQKAFKALDSAPQAPSVLENGKERSSSTAAAAFNPSASALPTGGRRFVFDGTSHGFRAINLSEVSNGQDSIKHSSSDPKAFEALLPECHPDSIGAVRAAMKTAEFLQGARAAGKDPYSVMPREVRVFAGVGTGPLNKNRAKFELYNVYSGEGNDSKRSSCSLGDLRNRNLAGLGLDRSEAQAAIAALRGADLSCDEARRGGASRPSSARAIPARPSVQFLRVATEVRGGAHAEGVFCAAGVRPSQAQKDYLTAAQITEKIAGLAAGHPDRAVHEMALKAVEDKNAALRAPISVPG